MWLQGVTSQISDWVRGQCTLQDREDWLGQFSSISDSVWNNENGLEMDRSGSYML